MAERDYIAALIGGAMDEGGDLAVLMRHCGLIQVSIDEVAAADVVLFHVRGGGADDTSRNIGEIPANHGGIISGVGPLSFIHMSIAEPRVCMESELSEGWKALVHSVWRHPQLV